MKRLVYGVGINDAGYILQIREELPPVDGKRNRKLIWRCPFYERWLNMLERCYSTKRQGRNPTYKDCTVCEEWLTFSNFKAWMQEQDWEGNQLDKDLLVRGNTRYSPETCVFVSSLVNTFVNESNASRGEWPIGCYWNKPANKFMAYCKNPFTKKAENLGLYNNTEDAHKAWLSRKLDHARRLASLQTNMLVCMALLDRYENYE